MTSLIVLLSRPLSPGVRAVWGCRFSGQQERLPALVRVTVGHWAGWRVFVAAFIKVSSISASLGSFVCGFCFWICLISHEC